MASQVSAPVSATVIAFDLVGAVLADPGVSAKFDTLGAVVRALGYATQDPGKPNLTLTLAPEAAIAAAVSRVATAIAQFDAVAAPSRICAIVHYGVVFRSETGGVSSFSGSAIRATQSALRRAPQSGSLMATRDFATQASTLADLPFRFEAMGGASGAEGLSHVVFGAAAAASANVGYTLPSNDQAFVEFVKRRLATDIGPFAGALVDRALRSSSVATQLVKALSREIDNPDARVSFEHEVFQFIKSRDRNT